FPLTVALQKSNAPIKPGITANVTIAAGKKDQAVAVPVSAVFAEEGKVFVYVETAGRVFETRPVQIGLSDTAYVEVRTGLKAGEKVAVQRPPAKENQPAK